MKKRFDLLFLASLLFAACMTSCSDSMFPEPPRPDESTEWAPMKIRLDLTRGDIQTRASQSSMKPVTKWSDIKHLMMILYTPDGSIRWAKVLSAQAFDTIAPDGKLDLYYETAPVGDFHFIAVANCDPNGGNVSQGLLVDSYTTVLNPDYDENDPNSPQYITETVREIQDFTFTEANLMTVNKNQLVITPKYTPGKMLPDFYRDAVAKYIEDGSYPVRYGIQEPGNIFRSIFDNNPDGKITIHKDQQNEIICKLERDVALLRVRLDPRVMGSDGLIDFTQNSGIFIGNVPQEMHFPKVNPGLSSDDQATHPEEQPTSDISIRNAIMSIYDNSGSVWRYTDPTEGYEFAEGNGVDSARIVTPEFPLWRDIILFPTAAINPSNANEAKNPYYITISAKALKGHRLHDGSVMQEDGTVYWAAKITQILEANKIYEFNIQLYGGGTYPLPPDPDVTPSPNPNPPTTNPTPGPVQPTDPNDPDDPHNPNHDDDHDDDPDDPDNPPTDPNDPDYEGERVFPRDTIPNPSPYPGTTVDPENPDPDIPLYPSRPEIKPVQPIDPDYIPEPQITFPAGLVVKADGKTLADPPAVDENTDPGVIGNINESGIITDPNNPDKVIGIYHPETGLITDPTHPDVIIGVAGDPYPDTIEDERKIGDRPVFPVDPVTGTVIDPDTGEPIGTINPETGDIEIEVPDPTDPDNPEKKKKGIVDPSKVDPDEPNPQYPIIDPTDPDGPPIGKVDPDPEGTIIYVKDPDPEPEPGTDPTEPTEPTEPTYTPVPMPEPEPDPEPEIPIPGGGTVPPLAPPSSITDPKLPTLHIHEIKVYNWGATRETHVEL